MAELRENIHIAPHSVYLQWYKSEKSGCSSVKEGGDRKKGSLLSAAALDLFSLFSLFEFLVSLSSYNS